MSAPGSLAAPALITAARLQLFAPRCDYTALAPALAAAAQSADITTPRRVCAWLGQLHVESGGLAMLEENLSYSAEGLVKTWPKRFPTLDSAAPFARNPQALANKVYGGRGGNVRPGDGWLYRGRGFDQTTFHDNYAALAEATGFDLVADPDQLATPKVAAQCAGTFWRLHGCNAFADAGDIEGLTRTINGSLNGLAERRAQTARAATVWRDA